MAWTCPLCGSSGRRNREDALPSWVLRYAEMQPGGPYVGAAYGRPYSGRRPPAFRVPVCTSCNGWMGRTFEEPAKRLLIPMFEGLAQTLKSDSQRVLAQWIAKSALMQELFNGPTDRVPAGVYRTFRRTGEPPERCQMFIGRYTDSGKLPAYPGTSLPKMVDSQTRQQTPQQGQWEAMTFTPILGHFLAQFCLQLTHTGFVSEAAKRGLVVQIWPPTEDRVSWPPAQSFTVQNAVLKEAWRRVPQHPGDSDS
jgi:hypothetical protein